MIPGQSQTRDEKRGNGDSLPRSVQNCRSEARVEHCRRLERLPRRFRLTLCAHRQTKNDFPQQKLLKQDVIESVGCYHISSNPPRRMIEARSPDTRPTLWLTSQFLVVQRRQSRWYMSVYMRLPQRRQDIHFLGGPRFLIPMLFTPSNCAYIYRRMKPTFCCSKIYSMRP